MFKIKDLKVSYKKNLVLDIKSFSFPEKGVVIINGANGSGKTTLFKALMNLIKYEGNIYYNDINIKKYKDDLYKKVCYIDQFGNLINYLTEDKNYKIVNECLDIESNNNYQNRKLNKLSGGQRKIVEEKRLDINQYETFLLDEPTVSLDRKNKERLINKIKELSKDKLVVIITHDKEFKIENSISYDINDLNNECEIIDNDYKEMENKKYKTNFFKISFMNFFKHIVVFIFLSIFSFIFITSTSLNGYRSYDYNNKIVDKLDYYPIAHKKWIEDGDYRYKDRKSDNVSNYLVYTKNGYYGDMRSIYYTNKEYIYLDSIAKIFVSNVDKEVIITDAISYMFFGDFLDHSGEYINIHGEDRQYNTIRKSYKIGSTIKTIFSENKDLEKTYLIGDYCLYIVLPEEEIEFVESAFKFTSFGQKNGDQLPDNYQIYISNYENGNLNIKINELRPIFNGLLFVSSILFIYIYFAINYKSNKKLNDSFKLKSLGVSNKKLSKIFNIPYLFMIFISILNSSLSYLYLYQLNMKYQTNTFLKLGHLYIDLKVYPFIILIAILFVAYVIRIKLFKKQIEV